MITRLIKQMTVLAGGVAVFALFIVAPALADPAALRPQLAAEAGRVTLGDLFQDAGPAADVVVASGGQAGGSLILDAGQVQSLAAANGLQWSNPSGLRRLIVRLDAAAPSRAARGRPAEVLELARDFKAGEVIQPQDLVWAPAPAALPASTPRDPREIIGQAPRRPMQAGAVLQLSDLSTPMVIRKDDVVQVAYIADGIKLVLEGKALGSAAVGDTVDIVNPASKKTIQAVASGPDQAVVGPAAERLKGPVASSKQFASLH
jgi:flagella basal body P-ring formation protein FlgA